MSYDHDPVKIFLDERKDIVCLGLKIDENGFK